jgi:purine catabolism regulator
MRPGGGDLRVWLAGHGRWDAAAGDLGVHRRTLRCRMRRVEVILRPRPARLYIP